MTTQEKPSTLFLVTEFFWPLANAYVTTGICSGLWKINKWEFKELALAVVIMGMSELSTKLDKMKREGRT